jgi:hypothetical protein
LVTCNGPAGVSISYLVGLVRLVARITVLDVSLRANP